LCAAAAKRLWKACASSILAKQYRTNASPLSISPYRSNVPDALLEEFDHLLFDALVEAGKRRHQINMVRIPKVSGS